MVNIRALAAMAAALALAGCAATGSSAATSTVSSSTGTAPAAASQTPAGQQPANPVALVRETGATPGPGEVYGSTTLQGWRSADGAFAGGERISVYTLPAGLTGEQAIAQVGVTSSDSQVLIAGPSFYIFVYPAEDASTGVRSYPVPPAAIAARVHGTVVPPPS